MGKSNVTHANWESDDGQFHVFAEYRGRNAEGRQSYGWMVTYIGSEVPKKVDMRDVREHYVSSGVGEPTTNAEAAIETLSSFISAWSEAIDHEEQTGRKSENLDMFPDDMLFAIWYAEELANWAWAFREERERLAGATEEPGL